VWGEHANVFGVSDSSTVSWEVHVHGVRTAKVSSEAAFNGADGLPGGFGVVTPMFGGQLFSYVTLPFLFRGTDCTARRSCELVDRREF